MLFTRIMTGEATPMSKRRTKNKTKRKPQEIIRTDVWDLKATPEQKGNMIDTIEEYRKFLNPLVIIVNAQWVNLVDLTSSERINAVEKMIHQTVDNPAPKHKYFQNVIDKHPSFRKFPSYLRRAAKDACYWNCFQFPKSIQRLAIWKQKTSASLTTKSYSLVQYLSGVVQRSTS